MCGADLSNVQERQRVGEQLLNVPLVISGTIIAGN